MLRGALPVPENIRLATANPEVVKGVVSYFRKEVVREVNPNLKADMLDSFRVLIDKDITIPDSKRESLKELHAGDDLGLFLAETFVYAINRFSKPADEEGISDRPASRYSASFGYNQPGGLSRAGC